MMMMVVVMGIVGEVINRHCVEEEMEVEVKMDDYVEVEPVEVEVNEEVKEV